MPKVRVSKDEWYPVYEIDPDHPGWVPRGIEVELTEQELAIVEEADRLFDLAQIILSEKYNGTK